MHHAASLAGSSPLDVLTGHHLRFPNKPRMTQTFSTGASELENMNAQRVIENERARFSIGHRAVPHDGTGHVRQLSNTKVPTSVTEQLPSQRQSTSTMTSSCLHAPLQLCQALCPDAKGCGYSCGSMIWDKDVAYNTSTPALLGTLTVFLTRKGR